MHLQFRRLEFDTWVGKIPRRREWQSTPVFLSGESHGQGVWRATVHGVTKSWTRLKQQSRHAYGMYKFKNHLHHLKRKLWSPLAVVPHPPPQSLPTTNLLSVSVDFLFWVFHVSGTTLCVSCCGFFHLVCFQDSPLLEHLSGLHLFKAA